MARLHKNKTGELGRSGRTLTQEMSQLLDPTGSVQGKALGSQVVALLSGALPTARKTLLSMQRFDANILVVMVRRIDASEGLGSFLRECEKQVGRDAFEEILKQTPHLATAVEARSRYMEAGVYNVLRLEPPVWARATDGIDPRKTTVPHAETKPQPPHPGAKVAPVATDELPKKLPVFSANPAECASGDGATAFSPPYDQTQQLQWASTLGVDRLKDALLDTRCTAVTLKALCERLLTTPKSQDVVDIILKHGLAAEKQLVASYITTISQYDTFLKVGNLAKDYALAALKAMLQNNPEKRAFIISISITHPEAWVAAINTMTTEDVQSASTDAILAFARRMYNRWKNDIPYVIANREHVRETLNAIGQKVQCNWGDEADFCAELRSALGVTPKSFRMELHLLREGLDLLAIQTAENAEALLQLVPFQPGIMSQEPHPIWRQRPALIGAWCCRARDLKMKAEKILEVLYRCTRDASLMTFEQQEMVPCMLWCLKSELGLTTEKRRSFILHFAKSLNKNDRLQVVREVINHPWGSEKLGSILAMGLSQNITPDERAEFFNLIDRTFAGGKLGSFARGFRRELTKQTQPRLCTVQ